MLTAIQTCFISADCMEFGRVEVFSDIVIISARGRISDSQCFVIREVTLTMCISSGGLITVYQATFMFLMVKFPLVLSGMRSLGLTGKKKGRRWNK